MSPMERLLFAQYTMPALSSTAPCALVLYVADPYFPKRIGSIILGVIVGAIVGFCKSPFIALTAFVPKLVWRRRVILILAAVSAVAEGQLYYDLALVW